MSISQALRVALSSLLANKLRSALTMLGMMVGVGAVITLMSIGQGAQAAVAAQFNSLGTNLVFVDPGTTNSSGVKQQAGSVDTLTLDDANAIADPNNVPSAELVSPELHIPFPLQLIYQSQNTVAPLTGVAPDYSPLHNYTVTDGDWFSTDDMQSKASNAVLGATVAQTLFGSTEPVGQTITFGHDRRRLLFHVIGVAEAKGGSGFNNPDNTVYIPLTTLQAKLFHGRKGSAHDIVSHIAIKAVDSNHITSLQTEVTDLLLQQHHI